MSEDSISKKKAAYSPEKPRQDVEQDVFDQPLQSIDDFLLSRDTPIKIASPANESSVHVLPLEAPPHAIRRAIQELESGSLDELLVHKLLSLERDSAEFRQEYVRLRAASMMRPRASFSPSIEGGAGTRRETIAIAGKTKAQITQEEINFKSPWSVNTLRDLWVFFGPWLTFLIALQLYYSFQLAMLFGKQKMLHGDLPFNMSALIIVLVSLFISSFVLKGCKGQDYHNFIPRLLSIGIVSAVIAITSYFLPKFL